MAIRIAPAEPTQSPAFKKPRKTTQKPVETISESISIQHTPEPVMPDGDGRKRSGFASMTKEQHLQASARGGAAQPKEKRFFSTNKDAARQAGAKGGKFSPKKDLTS
jgi:uncharacterized protein